MDGVEAFAGRGLESVERDAWMSAGMSSRKAATKTSSRTPSPAGTIVARRPAAKAMAQAPIVAGRMRPVASGARGSEMSIHTARPWKAMPKICQTDSGKSLAVGSFVLPARPATGTRR